MDSLHHKYWKGCPFLVILKEKKKGSMPYERKSLIISSSLRKGGNSETLCDAFQKGAEEAGYQVEKVSLAGKQLAFCQGCLSCQETRHCILHDDAEAITAEMKASDVIVFASPVYYYGLTGQLKTLLDRANPLFASDYKFP